MIPHLEDGCPSDLRRCRVTYRRPHFPSCSCYARDYAGDHKIGGSDFYGCPEDMHRCEVRHIRPHPHPGHGPDEGDEGETFAPSMTPTGRGDEGDEGDEDEDEFGAPTAAPSAGEAAPHSPVPAPTAAPSAGEAAPSAAPSPNAAPSPTTAGPSMGPE